MWPPLATPTDEAVRITDAAAREGVELRITGGVAVALRCPSAGETALQRAYADIDCVGLGRQRKEVATLLGGLGYQPDQAFNALHGHTRLFFWDTTNNRQLDVFLDRVEMCHTINLVDRLGLHPQTLSLADLLLLKLQVVETNRKDLVDAVALLTDYDFTTDETGINIEYIARLASDDWGLWRTTTMVAERADQFARSLEGFEHAGSVHERIAEYLRVLEERPKSRSWKLRARIGDRKRWYDLPEEAH